MSGTRKKHGKRKNNSAKQKYKRIASREKLFKKLRQQRRNKLPYGVKYNKIGGGEESENNTSSLKEIFLFELRDLENKINKYIKSEMDATELLEIVKQEIKDKTYLISMLRKTEIYLQRHKKDLTKEREKDLFVSSVKKEIRFLKKGIMTA